MKMILVSVLILGATLSAFGQVSTRAIEELHAGARSYEEGQFVAAQQHFEKAIALEPGYRYGQLLLAWALHAQYRPGIQSRADTALVRKAISTYKKYLTIDPQNEKAFGYVALLCRSVVSLHRGKGVTTTLVIATRQARIRTKNPARRMLYRPCQLPVELFI